MRWPLSKDIQERKYADPTGGATHFFSPISMKSGYGPYKIPETNKVSYIPSWAIPKEYSKTSPPSSDWEMAEFCKTIENLEWVSGLENIRNWYFMFYRPISSPSVAKPVLTSPLKITPEKDKYYVGDTLTAQFTITNKGTKPITFDKLTVGGQLNGECPDNKCPDFTFRSTTLQPNVPYQYTGTLTLTRSGSYHFFIAYYIENPTPEEKKLLDKNNWNACVDLGEGLTDEDRIEKIFTGPSTLEFANLNPEGELSTSLYKVIKQVLDVERAKMELEGQQEDILFNHIDILLKQLDPEQQDKDLIIRDIVKDEALSENEELIVGVLGGISGVGIQFLSGVPAPFLGVGAKWLGLNIGEQLILKDLHSTTVKKPEIGRMEIVYDETPKNKIGINIFLTDREDPIFITIPVVSKPLRTSWGDYICSPMWCGLTCPPEAAERALCPTIKDVQVIGLYSPGELRVYDSHGRVTGLVKRKIKEEIPNSAYFNNTVIIFFSTGSYRYEVVGTDTGTYSLSMTSAEELNVIDFTATDIPTTPGAIHQYTIDWAALSQGEKGVTVKIDSDGDGVFEKTVIADNKLSQEELTPTLPVHNTNTGKSFSTIQAAVDAASAGDTIIVRDGTYTENVDIDKSITLKSSSGNPEYTIVDAVDFYNHVFSVTANHVKISGFTVTEAPAYGIYLHNADYCDISDNICSHSAFGIYLDGSNSNSISDNTCINNVGMGISLNSSTKNSISNNTCSNNGYGGIVLECCNQNSISNNLCSNNKLGIGIYACWVSNNNFIYLNNFINNDCNAYSHSSTDTWYSPVKLSYIYNGKSHTNYLGNYWSDYTGTDANKNGIGDSPYSIVTGQDDYPLMTVSGRYFNPLPHPLPLPPSRPTPTLAPRPTPALAPRPTLTLAPRPTLRPTATLVEKIEGLTAAIRVGAGI